MRAVKAEVTSSEPISLSKAAVVLSHFTASETGARPDVAAYLRRAAASFDELVSIHREIKIQQKNSRKEGDEISEGEDDCSHQQMKKKKKKKKVRDCNGISHTGKPILEQQELHILFDESLGNSLVEVNELVQKKEANEKEQEKRRRVGTRTESSSIDANNEEKMEKKEKRKKKVKEESENEMKREEAGERKKRKHSYPAQGGMDGEMEQPEEKRKNKRRKVK